MSTDLQQRPSRTNGRENPHFKSREAETRTYLNTGCPAIIRLDGRAFHTYCRGLAKPYDERFMADMNEAAIALSKGIDGVRLA